MNSKLLEEAIVDAEALRSAALKNAEETVLEKYAPEVKAALELMLEEEMPMDMAPPEEEQPELKAPLAATDGEKLCPCPDPEEELVISIGDLEQTILKTLSDASRASEMPQEPEMEEEPMTMAPEEEEALPVEPEGEMEQEEETEEELEELQEDFDISEELLNSIVSKTLEEKVEQKQQVVESASSKEKELIVENKKIQNENGLLTEKLNKLLEQHNELLEENNKVKQAALKISKHLEETNVLNAKLFYKNQALSSDSLNERQKNKIVEAISQAGSVDEAKMVYKTLCNAVGTFDNKGPQSLSEAVERKGGLTLKPRQKQESNPNPMYSKWQKIAGIKK